MKKLLYILPILLFLACSSDNEEDGFHNPDPDPQVNENWLVDKILTNGKGVYTATTWFSSDSIIYSYVFYPKYVNVFFYLKGGGYFSLDGEWYIDSINHLFIQDNRGSYDYSEYLVEPINSDSTKLTLIGVSQYKGKHMELTIEKKI